MKNKFDCYDIVKNISTRPVLKEINGCKDFVTGMAQNEKTSSWSDAVSIYYDEEE